MTLITVSIIAIVAASLNRIAVIVSRLHADTVDSRMQADITRIQGMFDQPGDFTTPEARRIPGATITADLGEPATEQANQPPLELLERLHSGLSRPPNAEPRHPWRSLPLEPGLEDLYPLYEQKGVNTLRSVEEILRDLPAAAPRLTDTQEFRFDALMGSTWTSDERAALLNGPDWKCLSCTTGRDGEPPHASCVGCSCRCGDSQGAQIIPLGNPARMERRAA